VIIYFWINRSPDVSKTTIGELVNNKLIWLKHEIYSFVYSHLIKEKALHLVEGPVIAELGK